MFSAEPVCSCALSFVHFAHETAGAARIRHSLRPLISRAEQFQQNSGVSRRGNGKSRCRIQFPIALHALDANCRRQVTITTAAVVTNEGRVAVDADVATDERD